MADCPNCEYHKNRAARWRAEAYKQAGHDVIELPWVGLTDGEIDQGLLRTPYAMKTAEAWREGVRWAYHQLKEKNT
jgi:hypothetical protein